MASAFLDGFLDFTNTTGRALGGAPGGAFTPEHRIFRTVTGRSQMPASSPASPASNLLARAWLGWAPRESAEAFDEWSRVPGQSSRVLVTLTAGTSA
jgi:hypothetical protein